MEYILQHDISSSRYYIPQNIIQIMLWDFPMPPPERLRWRHCPKCLPLRAAPGVENSTLNLQNVLYLRWKLSTIVQLSLLTEFLFSNISHSNIIMALLLSTLEEQVVQDVPQWLQLFNLIGLFFCPLFALKLRI